MTENHDYETPERGRSDWHIPLNENFARLDADVEVRDAEANLDAYTPHAGAKFLATDTGAVYLADGTDWSRLGSIRTLDADVLVGSTPPSTGESAVWIDPEEGAIHVDDGEEFVRLGASGTGDAGVGTLIEGFEDPEPLADYRGSTANYGIDGSRATQGTASLTNPGEEDDTVILSDDHGPDPGSTYRVDMRARGGAFPKLYYQCQGTDETDVTGYAVELDTGITPELKIARLDDGHTEETFVPLARRRLPSAVDVVDRWATIELTIGLDGTHAARVSLPTEGTLTAVAHDTTGDDERYTDGDFGFGTNGSGRVNWDDLREIR